MTDKEAYNKNLGKCRNESNPNSLEKNVIKYEFEGHTIIESTGIKTIIPRIQIYDGPDY